MMDFNSPTWLALKKHFQAEIDKARDQLEVRNTDLVTTECLRERIAVLRETIAMADLKPDIPPSRPYV